MRRLQAAACEWRAPAGALAALAGALLYGCREATPPVPPPPPPENRAPVARPGGPYEVDGLTIAFDGSASSDPDGDSLRFRWEFGDGGSAEGAKVTHDYARSGSDTVRLTVTDSQGASHSAVTVAVRREPALRFSGAGNISSCGSSWDDATAALLDSLGGTVFTAGDNAFPAGSAADYQCFHSSWGRHLPRMVPVLGNHEYDAGTADAAFDYFGARAGPRGKGYYSLDVGAWHVIVLNDNAQYVPFDEGSEQLAWLRADLAANAKRCTVALWHAPLFLSSRDRGYVENWSRRILWDVLHAAGVDVVINGHQHHYERMAPLRPDGTRDDAGGIRQFNVGTGGSGLALPTEIHPHSESRGAEFGVLTLALRPLDYDWRFVPAAGQSFTDSGTGQCH